MVEAVKRLIPAQLYPRLLPKPAARYPADPRAVFILALCVAVGVPLLFVGAEPGSFEELLPSWIILAWGIFLVIGASMSLWGMKRQTVDGIIVEQIGSVVVGCASVIYATAIALVAKADGGFSAAITFGWGVSCFWRWLQLQALIDEGKVIVEQVRAEGDEA